MFSEIIQPRYNETDMLGHISNTTLPNWFEFARTPIFKIFNPSLSIDKWNLIIRKTDYSFERELFVGHPVEIKSWVSKVGRTSFNIYQEAWQQDQLCVSGEAIMIYFDYQNKASLAISDEMRDKLLEHLRAPA